MEYGMNCLLSLDSWICWRRKMSNDPSLLCEGNWYLRAERFTELKDWLKNNPNHQLEAHLYRNWARLESFKEDTPKSRR